MITSMYMYVYIYSTKAVTGKNKNHLIKTCHLLMILLELINCLLKLGLEALKDH